MTIQINDPWFENLYYKEFGANTTKFIDREKVLALLAQHNIDFVDYDMGEEKRNIDDFMVELKK
jgi:hypothetical protein